MGHFKRRFGSQISSEPSKLSDVKQIKQKFATISEFITFYVLQYSLTIGSMH